MSFTMKEIPKTLCETCAHGKVAVSTTTGTVTECRATRSDRRVEGVVKCTSYSYQYGSAPFEMKECAWIIEVTKENKFIGFRPPSPRKESGVSED